MGPGSGRRPGAAAEAAASLVHAAPVLDPVIAEPNGVKVPPASPGEENRLPIFESVESDWFRRGRHTAERSAPVASVAASWSSPADAGWRAAEVAQAPVSAGETVAGLPKRVPKANLVPGGVGVAAAAPAPARSAAQTRDRLASFQQGVRRARGASPDGGAGDETDGAG
jgi:hypothetical protein